MVFVLSFFSLEEEEEEEEEKWVRGWSKMYMCVTCRGLITVGLGVKGDTRIIGRGVTYCYERKRELLFFFQNFSLRRGSNSKE